MTSALVTGASGFVGTAVCRRLLDAGFEVRASVHRNETFPPGVVAIAIGPIGPETNWSRGLDGVDYVFHLAGLAHAKHDEESVRRVNVEGADCLARGCGAAGVRRLTFLSSAKVFGEISSRPFRAGDEVAPSDRYSRSKLEAEERVRAGGSDWTIVRSPLVYGPGVRANFLRLIRAVDRGYPVPVGGSKNRRSFIFVENLADALLYVTERSECAGRVWLATDGEAISVADLLVLIAREMEKEPKIWNTRPGIVKAVLSMIGRGGIADRLLERFEIDDSELRALGWTPPVPMSEGLARTIAWYEEADPR